MSQVQQNTPELAKEFAEAVEYSGIGPDWYEMPILRNVARSLAAGTGNDTEIDRIDEAHGILLNLQDAGYCVVHLAQLAELEGGAGQVSPT